MEIDVSGIPAHELLKALHGAAVPCGLGFLHDRSDPIEDAVWVELAKRPYHDYVFGRQLKVKIGCDTLDTRLYDRDQGSGTGARVVAQLRERFPVPASSFLPAAPAYKCSDPECPGLTYRAEDIRHPFCAASEHQGALEGKA